MAKYLVIVESPAKVKTIKKFLGANYEVMASQGHIRDLPKSQMGIDIDNDFEPKYITIRGKGDILAALRKEVKKADKVYLATDPDREGEAISWHLAKALKLEDKDIYRITFNEITKNAVKASIKNARKIDMNLVDAQQTRRILDRLVGYEISPLLWAKVKRGLSAGRVQSVALRIICDREDEINAFIPEEYWTLDAELSVKGERKTLLAKFYGDENGKLTISSKEQADRIMAEMQKEEFHVLEVKKGEFYALVGGNGTGKSTTLSLLSGIHRPYRGKILLDGRDIRKISDKELFHHFLGVLPQNPQSLFVGNTVEEDLWEMIGGLSLIRHKEDEKRVEKVVEDTEIGHLLQAHPYDLSGGEQQRAALAKVLLLEPQILLLDEPTKGLDGFYKSKLAGIFQKLQEKGITILMVSHDIEFCASYGDTCAMFFDGSIVTSCEAREFFTGNSFYTTAANRMARQIFPDAVTVKDVIKACRRSRQQE